MSHLCTRMKWWSNIGGRGIPHDEKKIHPMRDAKLYLMCWMSNQIRMYNKIGTSFLLLVTISLRSKNYQMRKKPTLLPKKPPPKKHKKQENTSKKPKPGGFFKTVNVNRYGRTGFSPCGLPRHGGVSDSAAAHGNFVAWPKFEGFHPTEQRKKKPGCLGFCWALYYPVI